MHGTTWSGVPKSKGEYLILSLLYTVVFQLTGSCRSGCNARPPSMKSRTPKRSHMIIHRVKFQTESPKLTRFRLYYGELKPFKIYLSSPILSVSFTTYVCHKIKPTLWEYRPSTLLGRSNKNWTWIAKSKVIMLSHFPLPSSPLPSLWACMLMSLAPLFGLKEISRKQSNPFAFSGWKVLWTTS